MPVGVKSSRRRVTRVPPHSAVFIGTLFASTSSMNGSLSVTDVSRVASDAVRDEAHGFEVMGVFPGGSDSDYAEVLIRLQGCREEPCQMTLGVFRDVSESALREEIVAKVRRHYDEHHDRTIG
jgi:hypothetical protein